jgi:hypothetical protein
MSGKPPGSARPLDRAPWPERLTARVVTPGPRPAIHGYDVEDDLALHYSFAETALLALTGEPPTPEVGRAFEVALQFAAPAPLHEAPTHAAVLARICAATPSAIQGTAAIALAEQARALVAEQRAWIEALSGASGASGAGVAALCAGAVPDDERASVARLRRALHGVLDVPALAHDVGRTAALVAVFHACGLAKPKQIECALVVARLPVAVAEAFAAPAGSFRKYPAVDAPPIAYTENDEP